MLILTQATLLMVLALSAAGYLGRAHKFFELASHFKLQYLVASAACLLVTAALRAWPWAAGAALCLSINLAEIIP